MDDDALIQDIRTTFPHFAVRHYRALGEGWMSRALLVNDTHVFRFAKLPEASADLLKEAALLPAIAERVELEIPRFELVGRQRSGLVFVAYPVVGGEALEEQQWPELPAGGATVARQLATFMNALNEVPITLAEKAGLTPHDHRVDAEQQRRALESFLPELPTTVQRYVSRRFAEFLATDSYFQRPARLIHADLSPDHLLFDAARERLRGVIDFGDLRLADPDYEYVYVLEDLGADFTARVMAERGERDVPALLRKVSYWVTFDHVHSILAGLERREDSFVAEGVAALSAEASSG